MNLIDVGIVNRPVSLTAYAKRRGVSAKAVSKAVASGRLRGSVTRVNGQPKIADVELADREWGENTQPRIDQPEAKAQAPARERRRVDDDDDDDDDDDFGGEGQPPKYKVSRAWREAHAARREGALADLAELEVSEKIEELVPAADVRAYIEDKFTIVKTKLLAVPSRAAQQLPDMADQIAPIVEKLISEALEELAAEVDGDGDGDE